MPRFWILSDLHLEFAPISLTPPPNTNLLIAAGDIHTGTHGLDFLRSFAPLPVLYVAGNHEYYGHAHPHLAYKLRDLSQNTNVHFLDNTSLDLFGIRFLGCTLWTDYALAGEDRRPQAIEEARSTMTDHKRIRRSPDYKNFSPADAWSLHRHSRHWLQSELAATPVPTVVITHHAPHPLGLNPNHKPDLLSPAYASDLPDLLASPNLLAWIHGHTHHSHNTPIGTARLLANQRGYPDEPHTPFNPTLTLDLPTL